MRIVLFAALAALVSHSGEHVALLGQAARPATPPRIAPVKLSFPTDRDNFYYLVAMTFRVPALCEWITPLADGGGGGWAPEGYQIRTMRSSCYSNLAATLHDPSLCDHVVAVVTRELDGSKSDKADCLARKEPMDVAVPDPHNMGPFVRQLRALGYDDQEVAEAEWAENEVNTSTYAAYKQLRDDPMFLQRLRAAQSYAEPRAETRIRAANALEFLYEMVAVDIREPGLCSRISPNATFADSGGKTALLYSRCYLYLALNIRNDATLCEPLPRRGTFPHINEIYDSFERCREVVAVYSRPDFKSELHAGPSAFAHAADFITALQQIGYSTEYTGTLVARPEPDAYWEFVSRLWFRGPARDRNEFVRRVTSLK
jgi:hypothetical protein